MNHFKLMIIKKRNNKEKLKKNLNLRLKKSSQIRGILIHFIYSHKIITIKCFLL